MDVTPVAKDKDKPVMADMVRKQTASHDGVLPRIVGHCSHATSSPMRTPTLSHDLVPTMATPPSPHSPAVAIIPMASPSSPLQATEVFSSRYNVTPLEHHTAEDFMEHDGDEDFFLEHDDLDDPTISTESVKKRKIEEGEECSSHSVV